MKYEPYRSYADRFNVYALCTASESSFDNGGSTFFDVIIDKYNSPVISNNLHGSQWKNHIFERCIGPEFIEKIHDAHIKKTTDPNTIPSDSEYKPYYYVHDYIAQFAMVVNTTNDFGGAYNNREYGFHYFISPSDSYRASKTFAHEFGHGLLGLGDEYSGGYLLDDKELKSLNLSSVEDPEKIKWRQLLGFRNTYTCRNAYGSKMLVSSYECIMRDTNYQFCEVCRLQGFKRMSQLVKDVDLYVATPEVKEYTGAYSKPSDFTDLETSSYYNYTYNRNDRLLSGNSKSRFNTNMNGKKIELRTVIQNISDKNARQLTFKMWIKHSDGSVATDSSGNPLQTVQTFDIPVWNDKANFWPLGALDHIKSDFNSGLKSCSLIYQIPSDAQLKSGDTVAFQVLDENGNVLAESKRFTNETIYSEFDVERIETERRRMTTFVVEDDHRWAEFDLEVKDTTLSRYVNPAPFVPADKTDRDRRCDEILMIQAMGLKKRLEHTNCKTAVIGISGGLDSTLALLVTVRAFDLLGKDHKDIAAVTMPGFGTTDRTYDLSLIHI